MRGEGRALTPSNDEPDCRIRASDDTKRRKVPHVLVVCDGEQHPVELDIKRPGAISDSASTGRKRFFRKKETYKYPAPPTALEITTKSPRVRRRSDSQEERVMTTAVTA